MSCIFRLTTAVAAIALPLMAFPDVTRAQQQPETQHAIRIGAAGGVVVPTSNTRSALRQGVHAQAFLLVNLLPGVPLRLNLTYQKFDLRQALSTATAPTAGADTSTTRILAGIAGTQIELMRAPVRPYVTLGIGGFDVRTALQDAVAGARTSQLNFGIDAGAGLSLRIGRLDAFVEGRLQNVYTQRGLIDAKSIQAVPVSFGVLF